MLLLFYLPPSDSTLSEDTGSQDCCDVGIDSQTLQPFGQISSPKRLYQLTPWGFELIPMAAKQCGFINLLLSNGWNVGQSQVKPRYIVDIKSSKHKVSIETAKCEHFYVFNEIDL
jgi:hypothetical protein